MTQPGLVPAATLAARRASRAFAAGAAVGVVGGLVGLGGAEFRLPLLIGVFAFGALAAVIVNKAMSLLVVLVAVPARLVAVPATEVLAHLDVVVNLLAGALAGAWVGASWAARAQEGTLYRVLAVLLVAIAVVFTGYHLGWLTTVSLPPATLIVAGILAGFGIGAVAAVMGVAGGELLIPTIAVLYGLDVKLAGSLSLLVSLPTMVVAFLRYSRSQAFTVLGQVPAFVAAMAAGSVAGTLLGGLMAGEVPVGVIVPLVVVLLLASAVKVWNHA